MPALAARLGVDERHLRRLFERHLGAPPIAVAQTRRILFAKQLIQETRLPMGDIAAITQSEAAEYAPILRKDIWRAETR